LRDGSDIALVVECKATKLTLEAQFSEDPTVDAARGYDELAYGVFQIWRYFSHVRRGITDKYRLKSNAYGLVLTLDTWLAHSRELREDVLSRAIKLADSEGEIISADRRAIVFSPIQDIEEVLTKSSDDAFLETISASTEDRFSGWDLPSIQREAGKADLDDRPFPFDLVDVLPAWKALKENLEKRRVADK
jgi:hypothetical protein